MVGFKSDGQTVAAEFRLPHDIDVEMNVIGLVVDACNRKRDRAWMDFCTLTPEDFFDPLHQSIWTAITRLHGASKHVDLSTVLGETCAEYGGVEARYAMDVKRHLVNCVASIITWANNPSYCSVIRDLAEKRRMISNCMQFAQRASSEGFSSSAADLAGEAIADLQVKVSGQRDLVGPTSIIKDIVAKLDKPMKVTPTGLPRLDAALRGGFHQHRFYGFGADQKAGKSTLLAATISYNMALAGEPHVYICLEMDPEQMFQRYLARWIAEQSGADTNTDIFYDRRQTDSKWFREYLQAAVEVFDEKKSGLWFLQRPRMHIKELKSVLARIGLSGKYKGVFIDYMQLIGGCQGGNMTAHLDDVNQTIAEFVGSYPIWVCAAAQMNQEGGVRGGRGMNAAADMVLGINKIEYDGIEGEAPYYKAWIEMHASRYTPVIHIGSEDEPAYDFNIAAGPSYKELPRPTAVRNFAQGLK
jgi:replicative DNA helicase